MLTTKNNTVINLSIGEQVMLQKGKEAEDTSNERPLTNQEKTWRKRRQDFLFNLKETKINSNPYGRGTNMFSLEARAHYF